MEAAMCEHVLCLCPVGSARQIKPREEENKRIKDERIESQGGFSGQTA